MSIRFQKKIEDLHLLSSLGDLHLRLTSRRQNVVNFISFSQMAFLNIVKLREVPIIVVLSIILKHGYQTR